MKSIKKQKIEQGSQDSLNLPPIKPGEPTYIRIKVAPASKHKKIKLMSDGETYKIYVQAQPERGKANLEMIKFLAQLYSINRKQIKIISGEFEQIKLIKISNE